MRGIVEDRVVIITGAGNGIGRAHALMFAREGAQVVVNDLGGARDGSGASAESAQAVVDEIRATGGDAVANYDDVSTWDGAERLIRTALDTFGTLDVLVNNAGILRDRMLVNMSEAEWDAVIRVHLKGTFAPSRLAAAYWRDQSKAGNQPDARIVTTTSPSGLFGNLGQTNYGAAKAGIAAFTVIAAGELARYGITVNAVAPVALTRLTEDLARYAEIDEDSRAALAPETISPLVVWLGSTASAEVTGRVFSIRGNRVSVTEGWANGPTVDREERWTPGELGEVLPGLVLAAAPNADMRGNRMTDGSRSAIAGG
jgi:NAD(P)-dependent dehydrogenase (short-subunit alcohol dehydrogenase family)